MGLDEAVEAVRAAHPGALRVRSTSASMASRAAARTPFAPYRAASRRAGRRSSRAFARRAVEDAEKPDTTRTQDAAASAVVEEQTTSGEMVRLLGVTLSRYTGSGAAMLRNGGAAVRHHAAVARGDTDAVTRPLSWSPLMTLGVELLSGFLEGIAIEDAEVAALRPRDDGETSDSKTCSWAAYGEKTRS